MNVKELVIMSFIEVNGRKMIFGIRNHFLFTMIYW
nr:MAG TPA: hypothetical protein [Caudoviricetes sp.]